jgi:ADP-ribose pyrophosphatase YjhB (NUDIX family)
VSADWLGDEELAEARRLVPIFCVDVLLWRRGSGSLEFGLIERLDAYGEPTWNLIGGRVRRDEPIAEAIRRHIENAIELPGFEPPDPRRPDVLTEYLHRDAPVASSGDVPFDPRQHAVAVGYLVEVRGDADLRPGGEARDFRWFAAADLPPADAIGFGQWEEVKGLVRRAEICGADA